MVEKTHGTVKKQNMGNKSCPEIETVRAVIAVVIFNLSCAPNHSLKAADISKAKCN